MTASVRAQALQLFVLRDGDLAASEVFSEGSYTIGRGGECDVALDHPGVPELQLDFLEGRVRLSGCGGFHVNGLRVAEAEVGSADDIWLGPYLLKTRLIGQRRPQFGQLTKSPGSPRSPRGPGALVLVPQEAAASLPLDPLDPDDVDELLEAALAEPAHPIEISEEEAARILTPLTSLTLRREELLAPEPSLADLVPSFDRMPEHREAPATRDDPLDELEILDAIDLGVEEAKEPDDLALELAAKASRATKAKVPKSPPSLGVTTPGLTTAAAFPERAPLAIVAPQLALDTSAPLWAPHANELALELDSAAEPSSWTRTENETPAWVRTVQPASPAPRPAPRSFQQRTAASGLALAGSPVGVLHARVFWGDTLLLVRNFTPGADGFTDPRDAAALQQFGFAPRIDEPLVRAAGAAWSIQPPVGARAFHRTAGAWAAADPSASRELRLSLGSAIRLSNERFHLELSAQAAPQSLARANRSIDLQLLALVLSLALGLGLFLHALPKVQPQRALEPEMVRHVRLGIEKKREPPKQKKKPLPTPDAPVAQKPAAVPLGQATNWKQAALPLRSLDKITKATRGLGNLLASLTATAVPRGGRRDALALLPSMGRAPAPLPGLGGTGPGGALGQVTKGGELLRGGSAGLLAGATGGSGAVSGVPVSVPSRPTRVQGSIDRDLVAKVINESVGQMRACYERALLRDPSLGAGKVLLEWTIDSAGDVSEVRTKLATLKSSETVSCLLDLLRTLKFPKPNGGVVIVSYPVLFNSVGY